MAVSSPRPARFTAGLQSDGPGFPLANMGMQNPFFYHIVYDDFDESTGVTGDWTQTKTGNGTIALTAGDGGLALFTTNSSTPIATDVCVIQKPIAGMSLPQIATAGKKMFFLCRVQLHDVVNAGLTCGLMQASTTPFTLADGIMFLKASGSASNLILRTTVGSANTDLTIPTTDYALANDTNIDLGFEVDRSGNVKAFVGSNMIGWIPTYQGGVLQGGRGPVGSLAAPALTAVNLALTCAMRSGTTASTTMTLDCIMAAKER